jgi:ribonuclease HI
MGSTYHDFPRMNYRRMVTNNNGSVGPLQHMRSSQDVLMGGASNLSGDPENILGNYPRRAYLGPPQSDLNLRAIDVLCQPSTYSFNPPPMTPVHWLPLTAQVLLQELAELGPVAIFSDGYITSNLPSFSGSVGIVIMSDLPQWRDLPIISLQLTDGQRLDSLSAFSMESLGILTALSIASSLSSPEVTIFSDCQSAVLKLHKLRYRPSAKTKSRDASITLSSLRHWSLLGSDVQIKWVKGHPEREHPDASTWSREMWGNHLADRAAAGCLRTSSYQFGNLYSNELSITPLAPLDALTLSPSLVPSGMWYFGNLQRQLVSPSIVDRVQAFRFDGYLKKRDENRCLLGITYPQNGSKYTFLWWQSYGAVAPTPA